MCLRNSMQIKLKNCLNEEYNNIIFLTPKTQLPRLSGSLVFYEMSFVLQEVKVHEFTLTLKILQLYSR